MWTQKNMEKPALLRLLFQQDAAQFNPSNMTLLKRTSRLTKQVASSMRTLRCIVTVNLDFFPSPLFPLLSCIVS